MSTASRFPASDTWGTAPIPGTVVDFTSLRMLLPRLVKETAIPGIDSVRLLAREERCWNAHDKVFFVLATHDVDRDECIVRLMIQFEAVDYDLVPLDSVGMIPGAATVVC